MIFATIAGCITCGAVLGWLFGYDIGYGDGRADNVSDTLRKRVHDSAARLHIFENKQ